jgi:hypothetical protein
VPIHPADEAQTLFPWRFLVTAPANFAVFAHMIVEHGEGMVAASAVRAVELDVVIVVRHSFVDSSPKRHSGGRWKSVTLGEIEGVEVGNHFSMHFPMV